MGHNKNISVAQQKYFCGTVKIFLWHSKNTATVTVCYSRVYFCGTVKIFLWHNYAMAPLHFCGTQEWVWADRANQQPTPTRE